MGLLFVTDYEINSLCNYEMKSWGEKIVPSKISYIGILSEKLFYWLLLDHSCIWTIKYYLLPIYSKQNHEPWMITPMPYCCLRGGLTVLEVCNVHKTANRILYIYNISCVKISNFSFQHSLMYLRKFMPVHA